MPREPQSTTVFIKYRLEADTLCFGERIRGALFRPCSKVFRYTSLVGALKSWFGGDGPIHAVARFVQELPDVNKTETLSFAPQDRGRAISTVPLEIEYLSDVRAEVFVLKNDFTTTWPKEFTLSMGAMKSKGFGRCRFAYLEEIGYSQPQKGTLGVRIPEDDDVKMAFGVRNVLVPVYGYLFRPTSPTSGVYVRSLFEGTELVGFEPILQSKEVI
jgi:hypothetical protein